MDFLKKSVFTILVITFFSVTIPASADVLAWGLLGTGYWDTASNWYPAQIPTASDDIYMDAEGAIILIDSDFEAQEIFIGGLYAVDINVSDAIFGTIAPVVSSDPAIYMRKDGYLKLTGTGILTLKGSYLSSDDNIVPEPSFMFSAD